MDKSVDLEMLAKQTAGFSGADLANLMNEAAILAARRGKKAVEMADLEESIDGYCRAGEKEPPDQPQRKGDYRLSRGRTCPGGQYAA